MDWLRLARWRPTVLELTLLLVGLLAAVLLYRHRRDESVWVPAGQVALDDSTWMKLAGTKLPKRELPALADAAKETGGKPVAGVVIKVPKRDTVIVHDTIYTERKPDGTRVGHFRDSTFAGVVTADVTAPPFPGPLSAKLQLSRPEFRPQVGFVQRGDKAFAVVRWQGEEVELESTFFTPVKPKEPWLVPWGEVTWSPIGPAELAAGVAISRWGLQVGPSVRQRLAPKEPTMLGVTVRKQF